MRNIIIFIILFAFAAGFCTTSCKHTHLPAPAVADSSNYPDSIAQILITECSRSGCHDRASYQNAGQLLLDSWGHLLNGGVNGADVVAYSAKYSPLIYQINFYDSSDQLTTDPHHFDPYPPPSLKEYLTLKNWVAHGAPGKNGTIPFAANPAIRQKIYLAMASPCNQVAVIDAQSKLVMRYITVGDGLDDDPHDVAVSSDGMYAYVSLYSGSYVQKIDTRTDTVVGTANVGATASGGYGGNPSIILLSPLDTALMMSGWTPSGCVWSVNTAAMQLNAKMSIDQLTGGPSSFPNPHGLGGNAAWDTFFVALQYGNVINKISFSRPFYLKQILIKGAQPTFTSTQYITPDPHQILMSPDNSTYFVSCENTNEIRVLDTHTDAVIDSIQVGGYPQEMSISASKGYLFVACMLDTANPGQGCIGSVYVINYTTHKLVTVLYGAFNQPHDIAVDEQDGLVFICSTNAGGIAHHATSCGGKANGWYSVYNLNTLQPVDNKAYNVLAFAYTVSTRFK